MPDLADRPAPKTSGGKKTPVEKKKPAARKAVGARRVEILGTDGRAWTVRSIHPDETSMFYRVDPHTVSCSCQAGVHGRACAHVRCVLDMLEEGARPIIEPEATP